MSQNLMKKLSIAILLVVVTLGLFMAWEPMASIRDTAGYVGGSEAGMILLGAFAIFGIMNFIMNTKIGWKSIIVTSLSVAAGIHVADWVSGYWLGMYPVTLSIFCFGIAMWIASLIPAEKHGLWYPVYSVLLSVIVALIIYPIVDWKINPHWGLVTIPSTLILIKLCINKLPVIRFRQLKKEKFQTSI